MPSHRGHMPPVRLNSTCSRLPPPTLMPPEADTEGTLKEYAPGPPAFGCAMRE